MVVRVKHRLKMVSFHSLFGLRTGLSEMGTCRVDSCKRQNRRHLWWLWRVDTRKERDWDEDPKTCVLASVKLSWLLKPSRNIFVVACKQTLFYFFRSFRKHFYFLSCALGGL